MENKKKRIVIALGGSALGDTLPEQIKAVKITAKAIVDLIEEDCEVIVAHGNGPQVDMINNAMAALSREDTNQPNTPLSVCVAISQACISYDLWNTLREKLYNREMYDVPVATMIVQVRVDADDPAFEALSKPIGHFMIEEQARTVEDKYDYIMKEDSGRGLRRMVAPLKPAEIVEIGAIRSLVGSGQLVIACSGGGTPATHQGNHLKGASTVIDKDFASELLAENLNADFLIIFTTVEKAAINFRKPEKKWLDDLDTEETRQYVKEGHFAPDSVPPKVQAVAKFTELKPGHTVLITLLEKIKDGIQGKTGTHIHLVQRRQ